LITYLPTSSIALKNCIRACFNKFTGLVLIGFVLGACEDPTSSLGTELIDPADLVGINYTDTLSVTSSTVLLDSTIGSGSHMLLVGKYNDPIFGEVKAESYFQIQLADTIRSFKNPVIDSVVFNCGYNYAYGDTTKPQRFSIHKVVEKIGQNNGSIAKRLIESINYPSAYFTNEKLKYESTPIATSPNFLPEITQKGSKSLNPDTTRYNALRFLIPKKFGEEIIALGQTSAKNNNEEFKKIIKGLALVPNESNTAIVGFNSYILSTDAATQPYFSKRRNGSSITIHYHQGNNVNKDSLYTVKLAVTGDGLETQTNRQNAVMYNLNNASFNKTSSKKILNPNDQLPAQGANKEVYLQAMTGLAGKIEFPSLLNLTKNKNIAINKAELIITPKVSSSFYAPIYALTIVLLNPNNAQKPYRNISGELVSMAAEDRTNPQVAYFNSEKKNYTFNITSYLSNVVNGTIANNGFLLNSVKDYRLNRLVLEKNSIKLRLYYTSVQK
jgi:hypothetical protein